MKNSSRLLSEAPKLLAISSDLQLELERQATTLYDIESAYVEACYVRDTVKAVEQRAVATASETIRASSQEKVTEARIGLLVPLDPEVVAARAKLAEAVHDAAQFEALLNAFRTRGSMLRDLASLAVAAMPATASYTRARASLLSRTSTS